MPRKMPDYLRFVLPHRFSSAMLNTFSVIFLLPVSYRLFLAPKTAPITCVLYFPVVFLPQRLYFPCHFPPSCVVAAFPYPENAPITYVLYFRMLTARFFRLLPNAGINILPSFLPVAYPLYTFLSPFLPPSSPFCSFFTVFFLPAAFSDTFSYRLLVRSLFKHMLLQKQRQINDPQKQHTYHCCTNHII